MRVLYAIQGTGNGHLSRAREVIPAIRKYCDTHVLISGDITEPVFDFDVDYIFKGLSFAYGKNGGIDLRRTYKKTNLKALYDDINNLPVHCYDLVINDFEPVSAWACFLNKVPCIALSHQSALLHKNVPKPFVKNIIGEFILKYYAPANEQFGFHFGQYSKNIFTPVIRHDIRFGQKLDKGHFTVYLPAYDDQILMDFLRRFNDVHWQVFSLNSGIVRIEKNITIFPVRRDLFTRSLLSCKGVLCGAGFETPSEALFLGKKLMVIPMSNQYEQTCNAVALKSIGVTTINNISVKNEKKVREWLDSDSRIEIHYPDNTDKIINLIFGNFVRDFAEKKYLREKTHILVPAN